MNLKKLYRSFLRSSLIKSSTVYTLTKAINSAIPFLLMPLLTRYLDPEDYGIVAMFSVLLNFVAPFTGLNIHGAIARQYYERDKVDMPIYVTNALFIFISSTLMVGIIFLLLARPISNVASFPYQWMWAVIVVSASRFITQINLTLWQVQVKPIPYGMYQVTQTSMNMGLSIWFVLGLGLAWRAPIQAQVIASSTFALFSVFLLFKNGWIKFQVNKSYIKSALNFGFPLLPHAISMTLKTVVDRLLITSIVGLSATGLYSVGYQVGCVILILTDSFNQAYVPWLYERLKQDKYKDKVMIVRLTYVYFVAIFSISISLSLFTPLLISFFLDPKYSGSNAYIIWISLGFAFNGMYMMVVNYIFYVQKTYILAWVTFSTAFIGVIVNYFAIKYWGAIGAAYSFAVMNFLTFLLVWTFSNRLYPMPWNLAKI